VNLRTPDVMARVQAEVEQHYRSQWVERIRGSGGKITIGGTTIHLAKAFGFCYGVERAIDLAYAAHKVFPEQRIFLLGEIIHNPDVNAQISAMGIRPLPARPEDEDFAALTPEDVVIVPAFGSEVSTVNRIREIGCQIVDTTCGDVMSVWKRVRQNAKDTVTSIIHGKASHEETRATASHARGPGSGAFLVVLDLAQTHRVCEFIRGEIPASAILEEFRGAYSDGFDPEQHLRRIGVANQTTMLRSETEEVQNLLRDAIQARDHGSTENFRFFDTICGATQERQDALFDLLRTQLDVLLVVGGYNSSNTTHLAEIGQKAVATYFVRNSSCLHSADAIAHFDLHAKTEIVTANWLPTTPCAIGITAGASCPNNLIEETILRVLELRGETLPESI
jgi:4-hydroxy-3-methylbut-2-enyl diphosphate reductase